MCLFILLIYLSINTFENMHHASMHNINLINKGLKNPIFTTGFPKKNRPQDKIQGPHRDLYRFVW